MARSYQSILSVFHSETPAATEFRRILYRILKKAPNNDHKSILITSSTLSEGKSTVSSLLAICAAKKGYKTLLIDADLRRPAIHTIFKLSREPGLAEMLENGESAKTATMPTTLDNLDIITAGRTIKHPTDVFDPIAIGRIIEEAKFYYDFILVDSAPIIPVSDPMLLSQEVDGIIVVIKAGKTQKEVVGRAVEIISSDPSKMMGVILNNISSTLPYYYNESYYGYEYAPSSKPGKSANMGNQTQKLSKSDKQSVNTSTELKNSKLNDTARSTRSRK